MRNLCIFESVFFVHIFFVHIFFVHAFFGHLFVVRVCVCLQSVPCIFASLYQLPNHSILPELLYELCQEKKMFCCPMNAYFSKDCCTNRKLQEFLASFFWFELFSPRTTVTSQYVFALWPLYLVCDRALSFLQGLHFPTELCYKNFWPANHYFCTNCTSWADCVFSPRSSVATSQVVLQQTLAQNFQLVARPTALIIKLHQVFHRV